MYKSIFLSLLFACTLIYSCEEYKQDIPGPTIHIPDEESGIEVELYDTLLITPKITYDRNSTYQWFLDGCRVSEKLNYELVANELKTYNLSFYVNGSNGRDTANFQVEAIILNNFEDLTLEKDTFRNGKDFTEFTSGLLKFNVNYTDTFDWHGFAYSNLYSTSANKLKDQFKCYGKAVKNDTTFILFHQASNSNNIIEFTDNEAHTIKSLDINNSSLMYKSLTYGIDSISEKLGGSDRDKIDSVYVRFKGLNSDNSITGEVQVLLGNFDRQNDKEYFLSSWKTVSLLKLGAISKLEVNLYSTQKDSTNTVTTPLFLCIDRIKLVQNIE